ncbi:MAG TPA: NADH-quinone oxidoreductase subunit J [Acidisoma sp.]|uniref:NADH-quinone oxidoreductase subunit J n=1 Tax=Acidisoma sp. TaxID=1872115 RepID=UPI002D0399C0|nr:NADH-quinone oxidoreductase subunit J [Acidisoma sp.]HTI01580.1 NADH-quinone oxidoreductase subunit J [Acidisoma sp.]
MNATFYLAAVIALLSTLCVISRANGVHALLYLIVSLLAVALVFYTLGAAFAAALEVIIYAGAIMVLFVFVVMMMNLGKATAAREARWMSPRLWAGPGVLSGILTVQLGYVLATGAVGPAALAPVSPRDIGIALFGPYVLCVELASMLLLAALVGAYRIANAELERR